MRHWIALLLGLLLAGCSIPESPSAKNDSHVPRVGDAVTYRIEGSGGLGTLSLVMADPRPNELPDGFSVEAVRIGMVIESGGREHVRDLQVHTGTGRLLSIGDLGRGPHGSEQYAADTDAWAGSPFGQPDVFRCVAGLLVPLTIATALDGSVETVSFASGGAWDARDGSLRRGADDAGVFALSSERPWPARASWTVAGRALCTVEKVDHVSGTGPAAFSPSPLPERPERAREAIEGRRPPVGGADARFRLEDAERGAQLDPGVAMFLRDHPDAWIVEAHLDPRRDLTPESWRIVFGSPSTGKRLIVSVQPTTLGPAPRQPSTELPRSDVLAIQSLGGGIVPANVFLPRHYPNLTIEWFTASNPRDASNADAAVWQLGWDSPQGRVTRTFSAVDGVPLATVVGFSFG